MNTTDRLYSYFWSEINQHFNCIRWNISGGNVFDRPFRSCGRDGNTSVDAVVCFLHLRILGVRRDARTGSEKTILLPSVGMRHRWLRRPGRTNNMRACIWKSSIKQLNRVGWVRQSRQWVQTGFFLYGRKLRSSRHRLQTCQACRRCGVTLSVLPHECRLLPDTAGADDAFVSIRRYVDGAIILGGGGGSWPSSVTPWSQTDCGHPTWRR